MLSDLKAEKIVYRLQRLRIALHPIQGGLRIPPITVSAANWLGKETVALVVPQRIGADKCAVSELAWGQRFLSHNMSLRPGTGSEVKGIFYLGLCLRGRHQEKLG